MRGPLDALVSPSPLAELLPAILRDDPFAAGLCAAFDEVLAPILLTLDGLSAYLDLRTTPDDLLPWLAQWMAVPVRPSGDPERIRATISGADAMHALGGTTAGIRLAVEAELGVPVEVTESGAAQWSEQPGGELPGEEQPSVTVVARPPAGTSVDPDHAAAVVRAAVPAHLAPRVRIVRIE